MNVSLSGISFKAKILLLVLTSCFVLGAPTGTIALKEFLNSHHTFMDSYRKSLFRDFDTQAKSQVELAVSILQRINERHQKGELSLDDAKTIGADVIRNLHFGDNGYIWADTSAGVNVAMLGKAEVEGKSRIDMKDVRGKYMMQEIIKNGMQPGGGIPTTGSQSRGMTSRCRNGATPCTSNRSTGSSVPATMSMTWKHWSRRLPMKIALVSSREFT